MSENNRVSVVIPAYEAVDTIAEAIASVEEQTRRAAEVIVVDDGSHDGTGDFVEAHFPGVMLVRVANGGPSRARNHGIEQASGDLIAFLDADDRWHPKKLERQLNVMERSPAVGLVASDWLRHYGKSAPILAEELAVSDISYHQLLVLNRFQTSTVLVKKSILQTLNGFDAAVDGAEDWDMWVRIAHIAAVKKLDEPLVMYRDVGSGYSKDVWRLYSTMKPMLEKHRPAEQSRSFLIIETWHYLRFWVAFRLLKDDRRARTVWTELRARHLTRHIPKATVLYLAPFLLRRWTRRLLPKKN